MKESEILDQVEIIKNELKDDPENPVLIHDLGVGYYLLGQYGNSIIQLKKAIKLQPKNVSYHFNLGVSYSENEQFDMAIQTFLTALDLNPNHLPSLNNLADCYELTGDDSKAHEIFHYLIRLAPSDPLTHFNLGNFFLRKNQHIDAAKCYEKTLELDSGFADAYFNIAWILKESTAYRKALEHAEKGLNAQPGHSELIQITKELRNHIR